MGKVKGNLSRGPKRAGGWLYRKLPWYGKLILPIAGLAMVLHFLSWLGGAFGV
jgi:hypothetical protein